MRRLLIATALVGVLAPTPLQAQRQTAYRRALGVGSPMWEVEGTRPADPFLLRVPTGTDTLVVNLVSRNFDPVLYVLSPDGELLVNDDYQGSRERSRVSVPNPDEGIWRVVVTAYDPMGGGGYELSTSAGEPQLDPDWDWRALVEARATAAGPVLREYAEAQRAEREYVVEAAPPTPSIPELPWPPPQASALVLIPELVERAGPDGRLGDVDTLLVAALDSRGYHQRRYFRIPGGFALVTQVEQFQEDGGLLPPEQRWSLEFDLPIEFSVMSIIKALFSAPEGHFRVLVFAVTDVPIYSEAQSDFEEISQWAHQGADVLPPSIGGEPLGPDHRARVLVYEFTRTDVDLDPTVEVPGLQARVHLQEAGLWNLLTGGFR